MSEKFNNWVENNWIPSQSIIDTDKYNHLIMGWDAAKNEILKELKNNTFHPLDFGPDDMDTNPEFLAIDIDVIEKIKKNF